MTSYTPTSSIMTTVVNLLDVLQYIHEEDHDQFLEAFPHNGDVTIGEIARVNQIWALHALSAADRTATLRDTVRKFTLRMAKSVVQLYEDFNKDPGLREALETGDEKIIEIAYLSADQSIETRPDFRPRTCRPDRHHSLMDEAEDAVSAAAFSIHPDLGVAVYQTLDAAARATRHAAERQGLPFNTARYWTEALASA